MIRPFRFIGCLLLGYHRMMVADIFRFAIGPDRLIRGKCKNCGRTKWRDGAYWLAQLEPRAGGREGSRG